MVTIIRDRIRDQIQRGLTLEQVKASRPTRDYDGRYGATTGPWTTDMFVEAVYRSLTSKAVRPAAGPAQMRASAHSTLAAKINFSGAKYWPLFSR